MAKIEEIAPLRKGRSDFNLKGVAKVTDYTFKIDVESKKEGSDWVYSQINLKVDCGKSGEISCEAMSGYGTSRANEISVHGIKKDDNDRMIDDYSNRFKIDWDDRLNEDNDEFIGDRCFFKVGLYLDENKKRIVKKFLTQYDMIEYLKEHLTNGMNVEVVGKLTYQYYNEKWYTKKEIEAVYIGTEDTEKHEAKFRQSVLVSKDCKPERDKETDEIMMPLYIVEYMREYNGTSLEHKKGEDTVKGLNMPITRYFSLDPTRAEGLKSYLKPKKSNSVTEVLMGGIFLKGDNVETKKVSINDLPDDIKELVDHGLMTEEEALKDFETFTGANNRKPEKMVLVCPVMLRDDETGAKISKEEEKYNVRDLDINEILASVNISLKQEEEEIVEGATNESDWGDW